MSGILSKITRYLKTIIQPTIRRQKNQSIETDSEMTHMIELVDKNIKSIIVIKFYPFKKQKIENVRDVKKKKKDSNSRDQN